MKVDKAVEILEEWGFEVERFLQYKILLYLPTKLNESKKYLYGAIRTKDIMAKKDYRQLKYFILRGAEIEVKDIASLANQYNVYIQRKYKIYPGRPSGRTLSLFNTRSYFPIPRTSLSSPSSLEEFIVEQLLLL